MNTASDFINDISTETAQRAFYGVSHWPEKRAQSTRSEYAETMAADYADLKTQAEKGGTLPSLEVEFARYREGYRKRYAAYLHSSSRCVSSFIAGPSNFPVARMNKRADVAHKRLNEFLEFRARALSAIKRKLRPDLAPIYAGDSNVLERLEAEISKAETMQARMKTTNAAIRRTAKEGKQSQIAALLGLGYSMGTATRLLQKDFCGRNGFADFELTNNGANIRRMKGRVEHITRLRATPAQKIEGGSARFEDAPSDNRVRLFFPGKPSEEIRTELKRNGFRWTPSLGCWQAYRKQYTYDTAIRIAGVVKTGELVQRLKTEQSAHAEKVQVAA